ncbi:hypothetical protein ACPUGT_19200, partial [Klebsiella aerogenes]
MTNNQLTPETVTRYAQYGADMMEWPDGGYVRYEDYAALAAELQELREARIVPDGWLAVPAEPTGDMLARIRLSDVWTTEALTARYKDMLRAVPRAPYVAAAELQERRKADSEPAMYVMGMGRALDAETASTCKSAVDSWV